MRRPFARAFCFTVGSAQSDFFSVCPCFAESGSDVGAVWSLGRKSEGGKVGLSFGDFACHGRDFGGA